MDNLKKALEKISTFCKSLKLMLNVYLAGEIHSNWREEIIQLCEKEKLDVKFTSPVTDHEASDNCGVEILGAEEKNFWKDRKGANINSIRTKKIYSRL
jgi:YtoQ family protein